MQSNYEMLRAVIMACYCHPWSKMVPHGEAMELGKAEVFPACELWLSRLIPIFPFVSRLCEADSSAVRRRQSRLVCRYKSFVHATTSYTGGLLAYHLLSLAFERAVTWASMSLRSLTHYHSRWPQFPRAVSMLNFQHLRSWFQS